MNVNVPQADLCRFNENVAAMYVEAFREGPACVIARTLARTIGDTVGVASLGPPGKMTFVFTDSVTPEPLRSPAPPLEAQLPPLENRAGSASGAGGGVGAAISDFLGRKQRPLGAIAGSDAPHPASDEDMGVDLFSDSGTRLQAYVIRNPPLFSAADRTLFTMLIPHLRSLLTLLAPPCPPEESPGPAQLSGLGLTPREREVLYWISEGKTNAEAAEILGIAAGTVRVHLEHIYPKLGVENRHGASRRAIEELHPARYLTPAGLRARSG